jgi:ADP-dependent NAD(P)H-hydrate dehydratase / NAD(P)H-hydrate epimerase
MSLVPRLLTARQAAALDIRAAEDFGISTLVLMENAGRQVAEEAIRLYRGSKKIAVFCGKGNNGGDGFVAARHLMVHGLRPVCFLVGRTPDVGKEAKINLDILLKMKARVIEISERESFSKRRFSYGLIVDALLGVGLRGTVSGLYAACIARINSSTAKILSVDIPSGLDATTGRVLGCCVKADNTVTFVAKKRGMVINVGPDYCGKIKVADIGLPF